MNKNAPITLRIKPNVKEKLVEIATAEDRSVSATIRRAVNEYIERREGIQVSEELFPTIHDSGPGLL